MTRNDIAQCAKNFPSRLKGETATNVILTVGLTNV